MPPLKVVAVILNWNGRLTLESCLASLRANAPELAGILVVDNGSEDGSRELVQERFEDVDVLENGENLGYAEGNNRGIRKALDEGAEAVLLVNNDVFVEPGFLPPLIEALSASGSPVGLAGPKMLDDERPEVLWCAGGDVTFGRNISRLRGHGQVDRGKFDRTEDVDYIPGATLLIHKDVFESVGLLDPVYFCYMEDVDFCVRARENGFRIRYVAESVIRHRASTSTGGGYTPQRKYMNAVNSIHFMRRHGSFKTWLRFLIEDVATWPLLMIAGILRGRSRAAWAKGRGLFDGWRGVTLSAPRRLLNGPSS